MSIKVIVLFVFLSSAALSVLGSAIQENKREAKGSSRLSVIKSILKYFPGYDYDYYNPYALYYQK